MALEIERKFLVASVNWAILRAAATLETWRIEQLYLAVAPDGSQRVRRAIAPGGATIFTRTRKTTVAPGINQELETVIDAAAYRAAAQHRLPTHAALRKLRHRFAWDGWTWELDEIVHPRRLRLLEIELDSLLVQLVPPPGITIEREVTGEADYSNAVLARVA